MGSALEGEVRGPGASDMGSVVARGQPGTGQALACPPRVIASVPTLPAFGPVTSVRPVVRRTGPLGSRGSSVTEQPPVPRASMSGWLWAEFLYQPSKDGKAPLPPRSMPLSWNVEASRHTSCGKQDCWVRPETSRRSTRGQLSQPAGKGRSPSVSYGGVGATLLL